MDLAIAEGHDRHRRVKLPRDDDGRTLPELVALMRRLLAPDGCPWDREQTLQSLRPYTIEEAYEVVDAIDRGDPEAHCEELGDLLLQIVFQSELAQRENDFSIDDVVGAVVAKMIRRHPWVFGEEKVDSAQSALAGWEGIKSQERAATGKSALDGVPVALPGLLRALRVGEKASSVGYDWPDAGGPRQKISEELDELDEAIEQGDRVAAEQELGDLLLSIASFARKNALDPEAALRGSIDRFTWRFQYSERQAQELGRDLREMTDDELDALWEEAKSQQSST